MRQWGSGEAYIYGANKGGVSLGIDSVNGMEEKAAGVGANLSISRKLFDYMDTFELSKALSEDAWVGFSCFIIKS